MEKIKRWLVSFGRWQHFGLLVLVIASVILHIAVITQPNEPLFDEQHYILDGRRIVNEFRTERLEHPPLAKVIIAEGIKYIGDNPWGWRIPAIIAGTLSIVLFYFICRRLGASNRVSYLASFLLTFENLFFIHGGMAMLDVYMVFFTMLAFWAYLRGPAWWWLSAIAGACAALSKFSGMLVFIAIALHWLYSERQNLTSLAALPRSWFAARPKAATDGMDMRDFLKPGFFERYGRILLFACSMLLAPIAFVGLYWVFDFIIWRHAVDIVQEIKTAFSLTDSIKFTGYTAPLPSRPWEWLLSPTNSFKFYEWLVNPNGVDTVVLPYWYTPHVSGLVSPTLWLSTLIGLPYLVWRTVKKKLFVILPVIWIAGLYFIPTLLRGHVSNELASFLSFGWFALCVFYVLLMKGSNREDNPAAFALFWFAGTWAVWFPLAILTDRVSFSFYYLPAVGAAAIAAALLFENLLARAEARKRDKLKGFMMLVVGIFIFLHLAVLCLLGPVRLDISIPAVLLVLLFALDLLGFSWRFLVEIGAAALGWVAAMRYFLYPRLLQWFGADLVASGYPAQGMVWLVGILASIGILAGIFALVWLLLRLFVPEPAQPPPTPPNEPPVLPALEPQRAPDAGVSGSQPGLT